MVGLGVLVLVGAVGIGVVLTRGGAIPTAAQDRPGPVLLVPGYGGNRDSLAGLAERVRAAGRSAVVVALPGDGTGDLRAQAAVLDDAVRAAVDDGAPSVDLVGYSAGGVVVRLWLAEHDTARAARRVVTLGSPLHGTALAGEGGLLVPGACPVACTQLTPGSTLLTEVDRRPIPDALPWLSIWTDDDTTVRPPDSARLTGAVNVALQQLCPGAVVAHSQLPTDPAVTGLVVRALTDAEPVDRTPTGCAR
ncbi:triacylglycerol esterase/lipase EstA (alpha/beta hydrolase family) [Umezawaea tangerina]|uniref:Triacylglycerol esterase/lipase EstA (Alpha/beta hydrolase family) n=2 Tax=Umezawaea tangerina TaxID=84725 RepID=A0A2T0THC3_9PSEU|nr:triacylglycerol esterase/lipase EstA (alpha/beta hydrolase family) [Umezawaea tangerina]